MRDYSFRFSWLVCEDDYTNAWFELLELEEAIFNPCYENKFSLLLLEYRPHERQHLYENAYDRWWRSIGKQ